MRISKKREAELVEEYFSYLKSIGKISKSQYSHGYYKYNSKGEGETGETFNPGDFFVINYCSFEMGERKNAYPVKQTDRITYDDIMSYHRNKKLENILK